MTESGAEILLVDRDPASRQHRTQCLAAGGYRVAVANPGAEALAHVGLQVPATIVYVVGGSEGLDEPFIDTLRGEYPALPVIVIAQRSSISAAVRLMRKGVFCCLDSLCTPSILLDEVSRALASSISRRDSDAAAWRGAIITRNSVMSTLLDQVANVAEGDASVLIQGPSGSGKELLAKAVHLASPRHAQPFLGINCSAIPENLLESELFGFTQGAFTGATRDHAGLFQQAQGGTLFLDEVGDMPLSLQVKLLRVLQEREIRPLGSVQSLPIDVRIVSATLRDLTDEVAAGRFRSDLFYRLNVVTLNLPSLSERADDIPILANTFLQELSRKYGRTIGGFAPEAMALLMQAPWPGNIRQLYNTVERAVALSVAPVIPAAVLKTIVGDTHEIESFELARNRFERGYLTQLLRICSGNVARAASLARHNRTYFYKLLQRHQLDPALYK